MFTKRIRQAIIVAIWLSLLSCLSVSLFAQAQAFADGTVAQLTEQHKIRLAKLKTALAIPTFIPAGYKLTDVTTETVESAPGVGFYNLVYSKGKKEFRIQAANDGIGSVDTQKNIKGRNPYFAGTITVGIDEDKSIFAEWIGSKRQFQPKGMKFQMFYSLQSKSITRQEALKVMQSLRYLQR